MSTTETQDISQPLPPPPLTPWEFVPITTKIPNDEYIDLEVIDISTFRGLDKDVILTPEEQASQDDLVSRAFQGLRQLGVIAMKGHGLSHEAIQHEFDLGKLCLDEVSEEEKHKLHARIAQDGSWAGYKPRGYYSRPDNAEDNIEHFDLYPFSAVESNFPEVAKPYVQDFRNFIEYNHYVLLRKVLAVISLGLGVPIDALWNVSHRGGNDNDGALQGEPDRKIEWNHSKDHLRHAMYHPIKEEDRAKKYGLTIPGHTDLGSVSFLFSQPIAGLQVLSEGRFRYIRHYPDHIIINIGDSMEFLTGGILKAPPHRVKEPPEDQRHLCRLGVFLFYPFLPETPLAPLDYPSLKDTKDTFEEYYELGGKKPMTSIEWNIRRSKLVGTKRQRRPQRTADDVLEDIHYRFNP